MSSKIVSVIIVTAGNNGYIRPLLDSLRSQTWNDCQAIVIDNSLDRDFSFGLARDYPEVKLCVSPENTLYCRALNKGIDQSRGDFILCLNDDVVLDNGFIENALKGFQSGEKIGMVSGKILRRDKKTLDSSGLFLSFARTARERGYGAEDKGQFNKAGYIFGVNGAAGFYRREMLEDTKLSGEYFDQDFGLFYEDLDLAWRAQALGWKGYYQPSAVAYHLRGGTARCRGGAGKKFARLYLDDVLLFALMKNRYLAIIKNESLPGFLISLPFTAFYDIFAWGYILALRWRVLALFFSQGIPVAPALRKRAALNKKKTGRLRKP
jgi:GT2 family glycosyltransferase